MPAISNAEEIREVYLMAFDHFAVDPIAVEQETNERISSRFARELIGLLTTQGLLVETETGGEVVWQTAFDPTQTDRAEAEAVINEFTGLKPTPKRAPKQHALTPPDEAPAAKPAKSRSKSSNTDTEYHPCNCGCGENVPPRSWYRPGHDARHAGVVGREIAANYATKGFDRRELLAALPSDALKAKAERIAEKAAERADAKANKASKREPIPGTVKVGKNLFGAHLMPNGTVEYENDKGEVKTASKTAAATFTEVE